MQLSRKLFSLSELKIKYFYTAVTSGRLIKETRSRLIKKLDMSRSVGVIMMAIFTFRVIAEEKNYLC